jgi:hypothetical protein
MTFVFLATQRGSSDSMRTGFNLDPSGLAFPCLYPVGGTSLFACVDVANTALVPAAMQQCASFPRPHSRLTAFRTETTLKI